ncbi:MAG TPA: hypothetical protein VN541_22120, partial [Tepidisphaeraceae bacterium]|nr:hypothetical protein [Tepidisphaeraceae bacterium]
GIPVMQYVAPQLWAWAPWRMKRLRRLVDQVACILPFEQDYFRAHGVNATFVGHPLFDQVPTNPAPAQNGRFPQSPPVIGLLTGSRRSEATHNFPHLLDVARRIRQQFPDASFLVPTTAGTHPEVERILRESEGQSSGLRIEVGLDRFDQMVPRCDLCITVSGTATLHVAAWGVPMVVVYRIGALQWNLGARWLVPARTFALVNVLAAGSARGGKEKHVVPEFVPWYGSNEPVAKTALELLKDPTRLTQQKQQLKQVVGQLSEPGASMKAARLAIAMMGSQST